MKNFFKLTFIALAVSIAVISCSEENAANTVSPSSAIVGTYDANNSIVAYFLDGVSISRDTTVYAANELVVRFTSDGKLISTEVDSTEPSGFAIDTTFYSVSGNQITNIDKSSTPFDTTVFTYTLTGSALKMGLSQTDTTRNGVVRIEAEYNATKR